MTINERIMQLPPIPTIWGRIANVHESGASGAYVDALIARLLLARDALEKCNAELCRSDVQKVLFAIELPEELLPETESEHHE